MHVTEENALELVRPRVDAGVRRLAIQAPPGTGKSSLLRDVERAFATQRRVIRVQFTDSDDAGLRSLVDVAVQLSRSSPGLLERVVPARDAARVPWSERLNDVQNELAAVARSEDLVILFDERRYRGSAGPEGELFAQRAAEVAETLLSIHESTVVSNTMR